jgi:Ras family protein A
MLTLAQGRIASVKIGAATYLECSAKTGEGIKEVFEAVSSLAMLPNDKLKKVRSFRKLLGRIGV